MKAFVYAFFLLLSVSAFGQLKVSLASGYGTYSMNEMKSFQNELLADFPDDAKITEEFPGFMYYQLDVHTVIGDHFLIGGYVNYGSTGGRIHYADYSGEASANQLIRYLSGGPHFGIQIGDDEQSFNFHADLKPQFTYAMLDLQFYSRLDTQAESESLKFTSMNVGVELGFTAEKRLGNFGIDLYTGFNLNVINGNLMFDRDDEAYLQNNSGNPVNLSFSGIRVNLGVSYKISFRKRD
jgi:hypothetical protein